MPQDVSQARLREMRAHLEEAVRTEGERAAFRRFGAPVATARAILRQERGDDARSPWALSWVVGLGLAASFLLPHAWMNLHDSIAAWEFALSVWLPFLAALAFAARCLTTRRWLVLPAAFWASAGIALAFATSAVFPVSLGAAERAQYLEAIHGSVVQWERNAQEVSAWRAGRPPKDAAPILSRSKLIVYVAGWPFPYSTERPTLEIVRGGKSAGLSEAMAERAWRENGEDWAKEVERNRARTRENLASVGRMGRLAPLPWPERLRDAAVGIVQISAVLLALNMLALLLGRAADGRPLRRARA